MLQPHAEPDEWRRWQEQIEAHLQLPQEEQEACLGELIPPFAEWVGEKLSKAL
jgi:hypothetical protein